MRTQTSVRIEGPITRSTQRQKSHQSLRVSIIYATTGKLTNLLDDFSAIGAAVDHEGIINNTRYTCAMCCQFAIATSLLCKHMTNIL